MARLLLVDDEDTIVLAMERYFRRLGFDVQVATSVADALSLAGSERYVVAITDLRLDDGHDTGGLRVVRAIRSHHPATRVVVLTAYRSPATEREAHEAGVDVILSKPLPLAEIARVVGGLCMKRGES